MTKPYTVTVTHFERVLIDAIIFGFSLDQVLAKLSERCRTQFTMRPLNLIVEDYDGHHVRDAVLT